MISEFDWRVFKRNLTIKIMKILIQTTALPPVPVKGFNHWQQQLQKELDKSYGTTVAKKLKK